MCVVFFFFFQAEDGIRDIGVTGVQTCALPICVKCGKWIHGRCAKVKRVTSRLGRDFVCGRCKNQVNGFVGPVEELCEEVESVRGFCYLGDKIGRASCRERV